MPGRIRRLLLTTDAVGGVWRYTMDLARGLSERGIDTIVAVLGPPPDAAQSIEARGIPGVTLVVTGLPLDWTAARAADLANAASRLASLAAVMGVQGAHLHAPALVGQAVWTVPVVAVAHSCVGTWWAAMRQGPPPDTFAWRMAATEAGLRRAAAIIAPTRAHAAALRAVYGTTGVTVVHNGAPPPRLPAIARERAVLTAGRLWDEAKGALILDAVAPALGAPLRAAGPVRGPNGEAVAPAHLDLLGTLDPHGMAAAYARATVFVSMARYEPFGLAVLEAAHAGLRLVLADTPGFRELWDGAATFVSTPAALLPALQASLDDGPDPKQAAARFTVDRMIDGTLNVHRAAASVPAPARLSA